jgi:hypothetical protein
MHPIRPMDGQEKISINSDFSKSILTVCKSGQDPGFRSCQMRPVMDGQDLN